MIPVTITPSSINLFLDGRMRTISNTHINHGKVLSVIRSLYGATGRTEGALLDELRTYVDIPTFIAKVTAGRVQVGDDGVRFDGNEVKGVIADRLLQMLKLGIDVRPLALFLDRLNKNPTLTAINEVYLWLESGNLPITDDGCFLAFKVVQEDFASTHRLPDGSKLFNTPGTVVEMDRSEVDSNRNETCSRGLHFCSWQYLPHFGAGPGSKVVVVKVAPEDVVAIPYDYNNSKGRAWRYLVLREVPADECQHLFADKPVVSSFGCYDSGSDDADDDYFPNYADDYPDTDTNYDDDDDEVEVEDDDNVQCSDCACGDGIDGTAQTFTRGDKVYTADEIKQLVADHGQRGAMRMTGIPRSTLQDWINRIS